MKWRISICFLCLLAGIGIGVGGMILIPTFQPEHAKLLTTQETLAQKNAEIQKVQSQLAQSESGKQADEQEQKTLREKIAALEEKLKTAETAPPASNMVHSFTKSFLKQRTEAQITALKNRLQLTPEQEAALRQYYEDEAKWQEEMANQMLSGRKLSPEEMKKQAAGHGGVDTKLKEILTAEQMKSYEGFKKEEQSQQRELMAHHGMNEITTLFPLSEEQKDKVYAILYAQDDFKPDIKSTEPRQVAAEMEQQKSEHLKSQLKDVLTPEQLAIWAKQNEEKMKAQQEMIKNFMPK